VYACDLHGGGACETVAFGVKGVGNCEFRDSLARLSRNIHRLINQWLEAQYLKSDDNVLTSHASHIHAMQLRQACGLASSATAYECRTSSE